MSCIMVSHFERLSNNLSTHYRLITTLGSSATSHIYVADDLRSGERVAIKVLRAEQAASVSAAQFEAEFTIAAQLEHPNIVPVYDSGTADGLPYYVMPYIEGESLRARLDIDGSLPTDDILLVAADVSAALDYAHRWRVVHRDIKPENILLHSGRALVLDFGIALALDAIDQPVRAVPPLVLGNSQYMSPELARGDTRIDARSDVYALGCVVYEMIWGHPPFTGAPSSVLLRHISAEPMPLSCRLPGLPIGVSAVVSRALATVPSDRFPSAGAFVAALRYAWDSNRAPSIPGVDLPTFPRIESRQTA